MRYKIFGSWETVPQEFFHVPKNGGINMTTTKDTDMKLQEFHNQLLANMKSLSSVESYVDNASFFIKYLVEMDYKEV